MTSRVLIIITGIICLTILEGMAIYQGMDGWYFTLVLMVIAAAMGVEIKTLYDIVRSGDSGETSNNQGDN